MHALKPTLLATALAVALVGCTSTTQDNTTSNAISPQQFALLDTVSPQLAQALAKPASGWDRHPQTMADWEAMEQGFYQAGVKLSQEVIDRYNLTVTEETVAGVPCFRIVPPNQPEDKKDKVLLYFHGGGYVFNHGRAGLKEGALVSAIGGYTVLAVDYRLAPQHPFPAAIDDAFAVYQELLKTVPATKIGVFGTSTGGGMSLILPLMCQDRGVAQPAAVFAGTPWSEVDQIGDTYFSNEGDDQILVSYQGWLTDATRVYAGGHDLKDPYLSPIYGDYSNFPPLLLVSGTRDLFLSNTVRVQEKMLKAERPVELIVYEGQSHAQYYMYPDAPETTQHNLNVKRFFEHYLK